MRACFRPSASLSLIALSLASALVAGGCAARRPTGRSDGGGGGGGTDSGTIPGTDSGSPPRVDSGSPPPTGCSERAQWIYLVDSSNALLRFEPDSGALTQIGTLACPSGGTSPFSMAVDRNANAYVLHQDRRIYQVSTIDASCTATPFAPNQAGFELFGMGFVANAEGSTDETLFVAGGPEAGVGLGSSSLGRIDVSRWALSPVGPVSGSPELTGNGRGELWGFFPDSIPMSVQQIDKASGRTLQMIDVSAIDPLAVGANAWAFAFWGGRYYMFYQGALDDSTGIYRVTPETRTVEVVRRDIGYRIVGAGVSTCAPTQLI